MWRTKSNAFFVACDSCFLPPSHERSEQKPRITHPVSFTKKDTTLPIVNPECFFDIFKDVVIPFSLPPDHETLCHFLYIKHDWKNTENGRMSKWKNYKKNKELQFYYIIIVKNISKKIRWWTLQFFWWTVQNHQDSLG